MGDVHKVARNVLVWLGERDAKSDAILRRARLLGEASAWCRKSPVT